MRKRRLTWLALAIVPACAHEAESIEPSEHGPTDVQTTALASLEAETNSTWKASFDNKLGSARHLAGRFDRAIAVGEKPAPAAIRFLATHKQLFRMNAPESELAVRRDRTDALGMQHVRFTQHVAGIPVAGSEVFVHFRKDGSLATVDSTYVPDISKVNTTPAFDGHEALEIAIADFASSRPTFGRGQFWREPIVELVVLPTGTTARLAYHVRLHVRSTNPSHMDYMIDASTRAVLRKYENLQSATPTTGTGMTSENVMVNLQISEDNGSFTLEDMTRTPNGIRTFTYNNQPTGTCSQDLNPDGCLEQWLNAHPHGDLVTSTNKDSWDATGNFKGSAVEAHLYAGYVYDYYKSKFGRKGIDNMDMEIQSNVHFAQNFANAFWDGIGMVYGDGDTIQLKLTTKGYDVIAHELTHGVTEKESGLEYHDQPGALNESMSDIFGAFSEHVAFPDATKNWQIGEKVAGLLLGKYLRDMADPGSVALQPQPDHMSKYSMITEDNGGVHINSGIPNNAAYLMTVGGTNKTSKIVVANPIGWEKAEQVWYRANTEYLGAMSDFKAAAEATLSAATDLGYSEAVKAGIECAWIAVGVITSPATCRVIGEDGGVIDTGTPPMPEGGGGTPDTGTTVDAGRDAGTTVDARPTPDATTTRDAGAPDATTTRDATTPPPMMDAATVDATTTVDAGGGSGGAGGTGGSAGTGGGGVGGTAPPGDSGDCSCRVPGGSSTRSNAGWGAALALGLAAMRRRKRKN